MILICVFQFNSKQLNFFLLKSAMFLEEMKRSTYGFYLAKICTSTSQLIQMNPLRLKRFFRLFFFVTFSSVIEATWDKNLKYVKEMR